MGYGWAIVHRWHSYLQGPGHYDHHTIDHGPQYSLGARVASPDKRDVPGAFICVGAVLLRGQLPPRLCMQTSKQRMVSILHYQKPWP